MCVCLSECKCVCVREIEREHESWDGMSWKSGGCANVKEVENYFYLL